VLDPYIVNRLAANGGLFQYSPSVSSDVSDVWIIASANKHSGFLRYSFGSSHGQKDPDLQALTAFPAGLRKLAGISTLRVRGPQFIGLSTPRKHAVNGTFINLTVRTH